MQTQGKLFFLEKVKKKNNDIKVKKKLVLYFLKLCVHVVVDFEDTVLAKLLTTQSHAEIVISKITQEGLTGPSRPLNFFTTLQLHYTVSFSLIDVK